MSHNYFSADTYMKITFYSEYILIIINIYIYNITYYILYVYLELTI